MVWWKLSFCTRQTLVSDFSKTHVHATLQGSCASSLQRNELVGRGAGGHLPFQATTSSGSLSCPCHQPPNRVLCSDVLLCYPRGHCTACKCGISRAGSDTFPQRVRGLFLIIMPLSLALSLTHRWLRQRLLHESLMVSSFQRQR